MKGTLFSSDFVKDFDGNLRLLEFNTDTGFISSSLNYFDFTGFAEVLVNNSITKLHVVYKTIAANFVDLLERYIQENVPEITSFDKTLEEPSTIYPTTIVDSVDTFILRMAYDESAIFDSQYCSNTVELYKLFTDNNDTNSISEFFYNSEEFSNNNLPVRFNTSNLPDFVAKPYSSVYGNPLEFHKVGTDISLGETESERLENYLNSLEPGSSLIQPFYNNPSDNRSKAIRCYSIIYGGNLDILTIASFETDALLDKPSSIDFNQNVLKNIVNKKHYYELTTNYVKSTDGGVFQDEEIVKADDTVVAVQDAQIGDLFHSFTIPNSPDSDDLNTIYAWSHDGDSFPSGSEQVDTTLVNRTELDITYNFINKITLEDGSTFRLGPNLLVLVYDIELDKLRYCSVADVNPAEFKIPNINNELLSVVSNDVEILDGDYKSYVLDMEETDTFFINNGGVGIKLITHNCFVEGTLITNGDGEQVKIETLKSGDLVQSAKIESDGNFLLEPKPITEISVSKKNLTYKIYVGGIIIEGTSEHPMYVNGKWVKIKDLNVGDELTNSKGELVSIDKIEISEKVKTVYNLLGVVDNRNFFVENYLSHNKPPPPSFSCFVAGTQITLANGDTKNIEDIVVGDVVVSYNEENGIQEYKEVVKLQSPIHDDLVKYTFSNGTEITCTYDHPFYVNDLTLSSYKPEWTNERYDLPSVVSEIKVGDFVYPLDGDVNVQIVSIEELPRVETQTYIFSVDGNRNFYANEILVHNK
jgi:hypothetical protein